MDLPTQRYSRILCASLFLLESQEGRHNSGQGAPGLVVGGRTWLLLRHHPTLATGPPLLSRCSQDYIPQSNTVLFHSALLGCFIYCSGLLVPCSVHSLLFEVFNCNCAQRRKITGLSCCFSSPPSPQCSSVSASYSSGFSSTRQTSNSRPRHFWLCFSIRAKLSRASWEHGSLWHKSTDDNVRRSLT